MWSRWIGNRSSHHLDYPSRGKQDIREINWMQMDVQTGLSIIQNFLEIWAGTILRALKNIQFIETEIVWKYVLNVLSPVLIFQYFHFFDWFSTFRFCRYLVKCTWMSCVDMCCHLTSSFIEKSQNSESDGLFDLAYTKNWVGWVGDGWFCEICRVGSLQRLEDSL